MEKEFEKTEYGKRSGRILNFRPCFFTTVFLIVGILFSHFTVVAYLPVWWCVFPPIFVFIAYPLLRKRVSFFLCLTLSLAFFIGFFTYTWKAETFTSTPYMNKTAIVYGRALRLDVHGDFAQVVLEDASIDGKEVDGKICLLFPKEYFENVREGAYLFAEGTTYTDNALTGKDKVTAEQFADDIRYVCSSFVSPRTAKTVFNPFVIVRERIKDRLYAGMSEDSASVAYAVLTGETSGIDEGLLENLRAGGIAHIFAVSGLHVGTLFGALVFLFSKIKSLKPKKWLRFAIVATLLTLYGGVCGYSASVLRAGITCLIAYGASLLGVKVDRIESLSVAVILLLLLNPAELFCVGFQLSFSACFGILFLAKPIQVWLERIYRELFPKAESKALLPPTYPSGVRGKVFSFLGVTVGAQCATAPILLNTFGSLSAWSLVLNGIFIPAFGALYTCTFAITAISCFFPVSFATVITYLPNLVWSGTLLLFETVEFSTVLNGVFLPFSTLLAYYVCLVAVSDKFQLQKMGRRWVLGAFLACFALSVLLIL